MISPRDPGQDCVSNWGDPQLHPHIYPNDELDPLEDEANALQAQDGGAQFSGGTGDIHGTETCWATEKRETIARALWLGYQAELQRWV